MAVVVLGLVAVGAVAAGPGGADTKLPPKASRPASNHGKKSSQAPTAAPTTQTPTSAPTFKCSPLCKHGGTCKHGKWMGNYCVCPAAWQGADCSTVAVTSAPTRATTAPTRTPTPAPTTPPPPTNSPTTKSPTVLSCSPACANGGTCQTSGGLLGSGFCVCTAAYSGADCKTVAVTSAPTAATTAPTRTPTPAPTNPPPPPPPTARPTTARPTSHVVCNPACENGGTCKGSNLCLPNPFGSDLCTFQTACVCTAQYSGASCSTQA